MSDSPRRPVVYLIAQPAISRRKPPPNLTPLYVHGDVVTLLTTGYSPASEAEASCKVMENLFVNFDPEVDFLVWAGGDTLAAVFLGMIMANMDIWKFRWLRYERFRHPDGSRTDEGATYEPVTIDLRDQQLPLLTQVAQ